MPLPGSLYLRLVAFAEHSSLQVELPVGNPIQNMKCSTFNYAVLIVRSRVSAIWRPLSAVLRSLVRIKSLVSTVPHTYEMLTVK